MKLKVVGNRLKVICASENLYRTEPQIVAACGCRVPACSKLQHKQMIKFLSIASRLQLRATAATTCSHIRVMPHHTSYF